MNKRTLFILIAAAILVILVGLIWFWFFRGGVENLAPGGSFGTGGDRTQSGGSGGADNNIPSTIQKGGQSGNTSSQNISAGGNTGNAGGASGSGNSGTLGTVGAAGTIGTIGVDGVLGVDGVVGVDGVGGVGGVTALNTYGIETVPGVDWLGGTTGGGGGGGSGRYSDFVPKTANELNYGSVGGSPGIVGSFSSIGLGDNSNGNGLGLGGLLGAGAGCAAYFAFQAGGETKAVAEKGIAVGTGNVLVFDWRANAKQGATPFKDIGDCLARTIGKAVIQQMTNSIVNWINSGFNGKPSFVTNFEQFFTNVGDQAAGEFIRGTGLSFLCTPFKLQIRVALAQSYAKRGSGGACTLTGITKNINSFMSGKFTAGGWGQMINFTTVPTNNPYGAYAYAQAGLSTAQNRALSDARNNLSTGGFISVKKCTPPDSTDPKNCKVVTPSKLVESSLEETLRQPFLANQLAKSFEEIISALLNQLVTRTLYQGLSTLSGTQGYAANYLTPEQQQAQADAQTLLTDMQGRMQVAQQYGSVQQGAIQDIQYTQVQLQGLLNCWLSKDKTAQASSTEETLAYYNTLIDSYNANITRANASIAALQDFQTQIINIQSAADVASIRGAYSRALVSGVIIAPLDVTNAQQDRTTLQTSLTNRNRLTATELDQCHATQ